LEINVGAKQIAGELRQFNTYAKHSTRAKKYIYRKLKNSKNAMQNRGDILIVKGC